MRGGTEDELIDRVLAGLRAVQTPPGMETRVLEQLASAQGEVWQVEAERFAAHGRGRFSWCWTLPRALWAPALLATVVAGVALHEAWPGLRATSVRVGEALNRPGTERVANALTGAGVGRRTGRSPARSGLPTVVAGADASVGGGASARVASGLEPQAMVSLGVRRPAAPASLGDERPSLVQARTAVEPVSFPAPPMPLTRQERLLLGMLRGGGATELVATLRPEAETAIRSEETEAFSRFFRPTVAGSSEHLKDTGLDLDAGTAETAAGAPRAATENSGEAGR